MEFEYPNGVKCYIENNINPLSEFTAEIYHRVNTNDKSKIVEKRVINSFRRGKILLLFSDNFVKNYNENDIKEICMARTIF